MALFRRRKIGLVLSGGGARGLAHIGVIKVLEREGIPVDMVVGTSMGGIVGAAYAAGLSVEKIESLAEEFQRPRTLITMIDRSLPKNGLLSGERVMKYLTGIIGADLTFDDLEKPLAVMAVDLVGGSEVILHEGNVIEAVRATMAFPGVFDTVARGDMRLADGGILNDFPVDIARQMGAEVVIGVDVGVDRYDLSIADNPKGNIGVKLAHTMARAISLSSRTLEQGKIKEAKPELILKPNIPVDIGVFNGFNRVTEIINAGEAVTIQELTRIKRFKRERLLPDLRRPYDDVEPDWTV